MLRRVEVREEFGVCACANAVVARRAVAVVVDRWWA